MLQVMTHYCLNVQAQECKNKNTSAGLHAAVASFTYFNVFLPIKIEFRENLMPQKPEFRCY